MNEILPNDFYCPKCGKKATIYTASIFKGWNIRRLDLPYFSCVNCLICSYDKRLTRQNVRNWYFDESSTFGQRTQTWKEIYEEAKSFLEKIIDDLVRVGNRKIKFKHKSQP